MWGSSSVYWSIKIQYYSEIVPYLKEKKKQTNFPPVTPCSFTIHANSHVSHLLLYVLHCFPINGHDRLKMCCSHNKPESEACSSLPFLTIVVTVTMVE